MICKIFFSKFYIVSSIERRKEFESKINYGAFYEIKERVNFLDYEFVSYLYAKSVELSILGNL